MPLTWLGCRLCLAGLKSCQGISLHGYLSLQVIEKLRDICCPASAQTQASEGLGQVAGGHAHLVEGLIVPRFGRLGRNGCRGLLRLAECVVRSETQVGLHEQGGLLGDGAIYRGRGNSMGEALLPPFGQPSEGVGCLPVEPPVPHQRPHGGSKLGDNHDMGQRCLAHTETPAHLRPGCQSAHALVGLQGSHQVRAAPRFPMEEGGDPDLTPPGGGQAVQDDGLECRYARELGSPPAPLTVNKQERIVVAQVFYQDGDELAVGEERLAKLNQGLLVKGPGLLVGIGYDTVQAQGLDVQGRGVDTIILGLAQNLPVALTLGSGPGKDALLGRFEVLLCGHGWHLVR